MRKIFCVIMAAAVLAGTVVFSGTAAVRNAPYTIEYEEDRMLGELSASQVAAKNYPVPYGYEVHEVIRSFDVSAPTTNQPNFTTSRSAVPGTYFDGGEGSGSMRITTVDTNREVTVFSSVLLTGSEGFMFWYQSNTSVRFRLRNQSNFLISEATLPSAPSGAWITIFYYGRFSGFSGYAGATTGVYRDRVLRGERFTLNIMSTTANFECFVDEVFTFTPTLTASDVYECDSVMFMPSLAKMTRETRTVARHTEDGYVTLSQEFEESPTTTPVNITYDVNPEAVSAALSRANAPGGSGFVQISLENISSLNALGVANEYMRFNVNFDGVSTRLSRVNFSTGQRVTYKIDVSGVENPEDITSITITANALANNRQITALRIRVSPITVYELPDNATLFQAEDLTPMRRMTGRGAFEPPVIVNSDDGNNTYVTMPDNVRYGALEFTFPNLSVGRYEVFVTSLDTVNRGSFTFSINARDAVRGINFADGAYPANTREQRRKLGTFDITRNGENRFRFTVTPVQSNPRSSTHIDYFTLVRVDDADAEPPENLVIREYPPMEHHEVLTVLNTFDDYVHGTDWRWVTNQVPGFVGEGTAFNLNSRGTVGLANFDNNTIVSGVTFDGDGIRFWYRATAPAALRFIGSGVPRIELPLPSRPNGDWVTIMYTDILPGGDMSDFNRLDLRTSNTSAYFIDEVHTIREQLGEVVYEVRGDYAYVTGFNLRLEDVLISEQYRGRPVVGIDAGAFRGNNTLRSITLPDSLRTIGAEAFEGCLNLRWVTFGEGIEAIGERAFAGAVRLGDLIMPQSISSIHPTAFDGATGVTLVVECETYAKDFAIYHGVRYRSVTPDGFTYMVEDGTATILSYSGNTEDLAIPSEIDGFAVTVIAESAFAHNPYITSVVIADTVLEVGDFAFAYSANLNSVTMSNASGAVIGEGAFRGNSSLNTVEFGTGVAVIRADAFRDCVALTRLTLPPQLTSIAQNAFDGTDFIADVVRDSFAYRFVNTVGIMQIPDTDSEFKYSLVNFNATIIAYTGTDAVIHIPGEIDGYTVIAVGERAFLNNATITHLSFAPSVRSIGIRAFANCVNLREIDFGNVRVISAFAFANCISLTNLVLSDLVNVSAFAFDGAVNVNLIIEETQFMRSALDFVEGMTVGWNLGNTLDSYQRNLPPGGVTWQRAETLWNNNPIVTQELVDEVYNAGFNTIRIPVTWEDFLDDEFNVDPVYMNRVRQVVDYAVNNNMFIILNVHHDRWLTLVHPVGSPEFEHMRDGFARLWEQIAEEFKWYDERLILQAWNEPRGIPVPDPERWWIRPGNSYHDWWGTPDMFRTLNEMHKVFHDVVRNSGGLNDRRYLMLQTLGGQFRPHQINNFWIPGVEEDNRMIATIHMYNNSLNEAHYTFNFNTLRNAFTNRGIPCVITETGIDTAAGNDQHYANWAEVYFGMTGRDRYNFRSVIWDDGGHYAMLNRRSDPPSWMQPLYLAAVYRLTRPHEEPPEPDPVGDLNSDGKVDEQDVTLLRNYLSNIASILPNRTAADLNEDDIVDLLDLFELMSLVTG